MRSGADIGVVLSQNIVSISLVYDISIFYLYDILTFKVAYLYFESRKGFDYSEFLLLYSISRV